MLAAANQQPRLSRSQLSPATLIRMALIKDYTVRHKVKPGITGWAQVNGLRGETETLGKMQARIEHDLAYLRNWSLKLDLQIILRTVLAVIRDRRAY